MHGRSTLYLLIVVLFLGGYIVFVEQHRLTTGEARAQARRAFHIEPSTITYLRLERDGTRVECRREEDGWYLVRPEGARARDVVIDHLLLRLEKVEKGRVLSEQDLRERDSTLGEFGLDEPQAVLVFGSDLAQRVLHVGRMTPLGSEVYVKEVNRPDIMTVSSELLRLIPRSASVLRVRTVFRAIEADVSDIELSRPEGLVTLHRELEGDWQMTQPRILRARAERVTRILQHVLSLRVDEFVSADTQQDVKWSDARILKIRLQAKGDSAALWVEPRRSESARHVYARLADVDSVFTLPADLEQILKVPLEDLSDSSLYATVPVRADAIVLEEGDRSLELVLRDAVWTMLKPVSYSVQGDAMQRLFNPWKNKRILRFLSSADTGHYTASNSVPSQVIGLSGDEWVMAFYPHVEDEGRLVFHLPQRRVWGEISGTVLDHFSMDPLSWRSSKVLDLADDSLIRITRTFAEETEVLRRTSGGDSWLLNDKEKLRRSFVRALIQQMSQIDAETWLTEGVAEQEKVGLGSDAVRIAVGLAGEESIGKTLLIGRVADGGGRYASLLGDDAVFILASKAAEVLLAPIEIVPHAENTTTNVAP